MNASQLAAIRRIADGQFGVVAWTQIAGLGIPRRTPARLVADERWTSPHPGVYSLWTPNGAEERWYHDLFAASLWIGDTGAASHRAAARLYRLDSFDDAPPEFTATLNLRSPSILVHRVAALRPPHVRTRCGLRVTSVERTLIDLAASTPRPRLVLALESALRLRLTTEGRLADWMADAGRLRGKRPLESALTAGSPTPTESEPETLLWLTLAENGVPLPERQYIVRDADGRFVARVDFASPQARLVIEVDGYRFHSKPADWRRDRARQNRLVAAGWRVLRFTWLDLRERPGEVAHRIAEMLGR